MNTPTAEDGRRYMAAALVLARRGLGQVWPNPAVGCVLIKGGRVLSRGWTQPGGRPHAEREALARAGAGARGATAYVSLEPCAHEGETGSCAKALVRAGVAAVVAAVSDPDPRTSGRGLAILREAGISVRTGVLESRAQALNQGFFFKICEQRPLVTLKMAMSLDGKIATASRHSRWITGDAARRHGHMLRARHDAILVGHRTAEADDPDLRCRLAGLEGRSPVRVVLSTHAKLAPDSRMVTTSEAAPVWLVSAQNAPAGALPCGVEVLRVASADGRPDPGAALQALAARGVTRLLIEGGAETAAAFLRRGLVDRICCYRAGLAIGGDGLSALGSLGSLGLSALDGAPRFHRRSVRTLGADLLEVYDSIAPKES